MRASYITTCDIINGPGVPMPGAVRHANVACRVVVETIIKPRRKILEKRILYVTMDEVDVNGCPITKVGTKWEINPNDADRLAVPTGAAANYGVIWVEDITPTNGSPYVRCNCLALPFP